MHEYFVQKHWGGGCPPGVGREMKLVPECRFIKANGLKCQSPALRGSAFCYFHARNRVVAPRRRRCFQEALLELPALKSRNAVLAAIGEIVQGVASNSISPKRAGSLLYALQMADTKLEDVVPAIEPAGPDLLRSLLSAFSKPTAAAATSAGSKLRTPRQNAPAASAPRRACALLSTVHDSRFTIHDSLPAAPSLLRPTTPPRTPPESRRSLRAKASPAHRSNAPRASSAPQRPTARPAHSAGT